jgi:hypothetical protein
MEHRSLKDRSEVYDRDYDKEMGGEVEELLLSPLPSPLSTQCSAVLANKF